MMKLPFTCFLVIAMHGMAAQADTTLPAATPFAGVDKKLPMLELLPVGRCSPKSACHGMKGRAFPCC